MVLVQDDPKQLVDSQEVPIFDWSGWWFDSRCEIFSLLDGKGEKKTKKQKKQAR